MTDQYALGGPGPKAAVTRVIKGQLGHEQAVCVTVLGTDRCDVEHGAGWDIPDFGRLRDHGRQGHRPQTRHQLVLELEHHAFGKHGRARHHLQLVGAQALRVQWTAAAMQRVHVKRRLVQPIDHTRMLGLHAQLPAARQVVLRRHFLPCADQSFGGLAPVQADRTFGRHQAASLAAQLEQQLARHAVQFDLPLKPIRAETAGRRTGFHQVKNVTVQRAAAGPDWVMRRGLVADFLGFSPFAIALLRGPLDAQVEQGLVPQIGHRQQVDKLVLCGPRQTVSRGAVGVFQPGQPFTGLVFGMAQGPLFLHLAATRQHLRRRPVAAPFVEQSQTLHGRQNTQGRAVFAIAPDRAGAAAAPLAQVAARAHAQLGIHGVGTDLAALHLALQTPTFAVGRELRRNHFVLQVERGATRPRALVKVKGQL